jgi:hypothetical protein
MKARHLRGIKGYAQKKKNSHNVAPWTFQDLVVGVPRVGLRIGGPTFGRIAGEPAKGGGYSASSTFSA